MDLARLRKETRPDHHQVESVMPLMRSDLDRDLYVSVLSRLLGIVEAWEQLVLRSLPRHLVELAEVRQRAALLRDDLRALSETALDVAVPVMPEFENLPELLGAMYVMEGSRLGGQFIAQHVDSVLKLAPNAGSSYFRGFSNETKSRWVEFTHTLQKEVTDADTDAVIRGARKMFRAFGEWMSGVQLPTA